MADRPRNILICSCEDTMPLDGAAVRRVCRDAVVVEGRQLCRAELERFRKVAAGGEPIIGRLHAGSAAVRRGRRRDRGQRRRSAFVNIRETAGWSKDAKAAGPKMAALIAASAEPGAGLSLRQPHQRRRDAALRQGRAGDRGRQSAEGSSRRHRADQAAGRCRAAAGDRVPGGEGHHPRGQGSSRRVRTDGRRLCRARSRRRAARSHSARRAMARCRAATS